MYNKFYQTWTVGDDISLVSVKSWQHLKGKINNYSHKTAKSKDKFALQQKGLDLIHFI